jgi:uncharacterized membrane protein YbhN (UPF0104 family)
MSAPSLATVAKLGGKVAVSAVTLYIVVQAVSSQKIADSLRHATLGWLLVAAGVFLFGQAISAQRHFFVIRHLGGRLPRWRVIKIHFVGLWFNQLLPTSLGGDVAKIAMLRGPIGTSLAVRSVIVDRIFGLVIILLSILVLLPWYVPLFGRTITLALGIGAFVALAAIVACAILSDLTPERVTRIPGMAHLLGLFGNIRQFRERRAFFQQFWTSTVVHVSGVVAYVLIGQALHVEAAWLLYFLLTPLLFLITLVPISLAGWGIRELGAVWLFGLGGIGKEDALLMSILFGLLLIVAGIPGALFMLLSKERQLDCSDPDYKKNSVTVRGPNA